MKIPDVPFAVLRFQYRVVRFPLQLIEDRVVARIGAELPVRLFYEGSLGCSTRRSAKRWVIGSLRSVAPRSPSAAMHWIARLDAAATQKQEHADDELKAKRDKAIVDQQKAHATKEHEVAEARRTADERKRMQKQTPKAGLPLPKKQADQVAARHLKTVEDAKRDEQAKIRAAEQRATAAAGSQLQDAQVKRSQAASKRAQADRVEKLADAEKQKRQSERANNNALTTDRDDYGCHGFLNYRVRHEAEPSDLWSASGNVGHLAGRRTHLRDREETTGVEAGTRELAVQPHCKPSSRHSR